MTKKPPPPPKANVTGDKATPSSPKTKITVIRIILTIVVLLFVYRETGPWTAIALGWIAFVLEKSYVSLIAILSLRQQERKFSGELRGYLEIMGLVSQLIELNHPVVMDIRWRSCQIISRKFGDKRCWERQAEDQYESRRTWYKYVKKIRYDLPLFLRNLATNDGLTRDHTLYILNHEIERLRKEKEGLDKR